MGNASDGSSGNSTANEKEILQRLLFDESDFLSRLNETIDRALRFIRIEQTGRVVLTEDARGRKVPDQIRCLLAGRYFAYKLGVVPTRQMNYREIAVELNRPVGTISPELTDLVREGDLSREDDGSSVFMPFHRIDGILRELGQSARTVTEGESNDFTARKAPTRRSTRSKADPVLQAMLEKPADLSSYASAVRGLRTARDKGLAALLIAKDVYDVQEMSCQQMQAFLTQKFPVKVSREAISMGMMGIKGTHVDSIPRGNEISYRLIPNGREYIEHLLAGESKESASLDGVDKPIE